MLVSSLTPLYTTLYARNQQHKQRLTDKEEIPMSSVLHTNTYHYEISHVTGWLRLAGCRQDPRRVLTWDSNDPHRPPAFSPFPVEIDPGWYLLVPIEDLSRAAY